MNLPIRTATRAVHRTLGFAVLALTANVSFSQTVVNETAKYLPSDGAGNDRFGTSVALDGTTAIIGAPLDDDNGPQSGSAYIFDTATGLQVAKLLPLDGAEDDRFGLSVAISGTTAIIGANENDDNGDESGSAYVFDTVTGSQVAKLLPLDGAASTLFGASVAISGTTAIVGAPGFGTEFVQPGSAYLFDTVTGMQTAKLVPLDAEEIDRFGGSVAISGTTAIIGASGDDDNGSASGSAYVFDTVTGLQIAKLLPLDGAAGDEFGSSVAVSGTTAIIGARQDDDNGSASGSAYVFDTVTGMQVAKLLPLDGAGSAFFGWSVAIDGGAAIIGARQDNAQGSSSGSAYIFDAPSWLQRTKLLPLDGAATDFFAESVALSDPFAIVGATLDDDQGNNSGSAYRFTVSPPDCNSNGIPDDLDIANGTSLDCNANQVPDSCDIADGTSLDCNANGIPDSCDVASGTSPDLDGNGFPDECAPDCDGDNLPDFIEITFGKEQDCNSNAIPDSCEIASGTSLDCDANGVPDLCDIASGTATDDNANDVPDSCDLLTMDCNSNGVIDSLDIAGGTSTDLNQDGFPDDCKPDCNRNGVPDYLDLLFSASLDCDFNGVPDECEDCDGNGVGDACDISGGAPDCDLNGVLDSCELASGSSDDCDADLVPDVCQITADPMLDGNSNGVLDSCEPMGFASFCTGDGGNQTGCTDCPCSNNAIPGSGGGCLNSAGTGAQLSASGDPSVSLPMGDTTDLRFALAGAPASAFTILNSGDNVAPTGMANPCFGLGSGIQAMQFDGLRCAVTSTRRHGGRSADANGEIGVTNDPWGGEGPPGVGVAIAGVGFVAGQTRYFQVILRDDPLLGCMRGLNTSQAVEVTFAP